MLIPVKKIVVINFDTAIHYDFQAMLPGCCSGIVIDYSLLHPDSCAAFLYGLFNNGTNIFGFSENVSNVNTAWNIK